METRMNQRSEPITNQLNILVDRYLSDNDTTLSKIYIGGEYICDGLEDEYREEKVHGETRIPKGVYQVTFRTVGGFHSRYLAKYGEDFHKGMLWVLDVPGFEYILIHTGNTDEHTAGCLLVGTADEKQMKVWSSVDAYKKFYPIVRDALLEGKKVFITYVDNDR